MAINQINYCEARFDTMHRYVSSLHQILRDTPDAFSQALDKTRRKILHLLHRVMQRGIMPPIWTTIQCSRLNVLMQIASDEANPDRILELSCGLEIWENALMVSSDFLKPTPFLSEDWNRAFAEG